MSDCFLVAVLFQGQGQVQFNFFRQEKARAAYNQLTSPDGLPMEVEDDYGTRAMVTRSDVRAVIFQDLKRAKEGTAEQQLMVARADAALQKRARSDPTLQLLTPGGSPNGFAMS